MSKIQNVENQRPAASQDSSAQNTITEEKAQSHWKDFALSEVSVPDSVAQLAFLCLNTGFTDAIAFSSTFIWPGFQTGNTVQLSIAIARLFSPGSQEQASLRGTFQYADALALCSLIAFNLGCLTIRFNPKIIPFKSRLFCVYSCLLQALLTLVAAITCHFARQPTFASDRGDPSWTNALGFVTLAFVSATMGVQGVLGSKLASPYATTVVLTSVYCNLSMEPALFSVTKLVPSRDQKLLAVAAAFIGGLGARGILGQIGAANTLFIAAGLRALNALSWLAVKQKSTPPLKMI